MYWYAKLIIGIIMLLILGGGVFLFRGCLPTVTMPDISAPWSEDDPPEIDPHDPPAALDLVLEAIEAKLEVVRGYLAKEDVVNARDLSQDMLNDWDPGEHEAQWRETLALLSAANTEILFTDIPTGEKEIYTVVSGDNLVKIASRFNTPVSLIQRSNGLDETDSTIYPGQTLQIYTADWNIVVSKSKFLLFLRDGERIIKAYNIGVGRQDRTPVGTFIINVKQADPVWYHGGSKIPAGHPENVLGTRWMGIIPVGDTSPTLKGYGIHGTTAPETIGTAASQGCVRMPNAEIEELYIIVPHKTTVRIDE